MSNKKAWMAGMMSASNTLRAVTFDGTNDYLTRGADLTGSADSKVGIFSAWVKFNGGDGVRQTLYAEESVRFTIARRDDNIYSFVAQKPDTTDAFDMYSSTEWTVSDGWHHILASWDLAAGVRQLYINDVSVVTGGASVNSNIDYTQPNHYIGAASSGTHKLNADLAQFYFNSATHIDLSVTANRRKFISASGKPVLFGADGSLPTGTTPIIYLNLADGAAVSSFATNKGSGGGMTLTGTLTEAATRPSL